MLMKSKKNKHPNRSRIINCNLWSKEGGRQGAKRCAHEMLRGARYVVVSPSSTISYLLLPRLTLGYDRDTCWGKQQQLAGCCYYLLDWLNWKRDEQIITNPHYSHHTPSKRNLGFDHHRSLISSLKNEFCAEVLIIFKLFYHPSFPKQGEGNPGL